MNELHLQSASKQWGLARFPGTFVASHAPVAALASRWYLGQMHEMKGPSRSLSCVCRE